MKKNILLTLICSLLLIVSCEKPPQYEIPTDENGNVTITGVSSATSPGISSLDNEFTVTATLPNAKSGDIMTVECLQLQVLSGSTSTVKQLLPLAGTQKTATVGADLKASITYTRAEANLVNIGDYVTVTFAGKTDFAKLKITLGAATTVSKPKVSGKEVDVVRTSETAYFNVNVSMKSGGYTGNLVVKMKNGINDPQVDVAGSPFSGSLPFLVPISGTDFAAGKDTMYYTFTTTSGSYSDVINYKVVVRDPYFYIKKTGVILTLGGSSAGRNILINAPVTATDANAILAIDGGSLIIHGGSAWAVSGKGITFVPSTDAMYLKNSTTDAIAEFEAGTPISTADPIMGSGVYTFKVINGPNPADVYYGMIKITNVIPGVSVTLEYRIGNLYAHLAVIQ
jgi:hypothetical protein